MINLNIVMEDGTKLNDIQIFKQMDLGDSIINNKSEAINYIEENRDKILYFSGQYVQGGIIMKKIDIYEIYDEDENSFEDKINTFVTSNSGIYDATDIAAFIIDHKEELKDLLK